jgi:hypothetical protein
MAQLKEDEWPKDGEPTTAEQEGDRVKKREGSNRPQPNTAQPADERNSVTYGPVINNVDPDQQVD